MSIRHNLGTANISQNTMELSKLATDTLQVVHDTSMHMGRNAGKKECKPLVQPTVQSVALCTIAFRLSYLNILTCTLASFSYPLSSRARGSSGAASSLPCSVFAWTLPILKDQVSEQLQHATEAVWTQVHL